MVLRGRRQATGRHRSLPNHRRSSGPTPSGSRPIRGSPPKRWASRWHFPARSTPGRHGRAVDSIARPTSTAFRRPIRRRRAAGRSCWRRCGRIRRGPGRRSVRRGVLRSVSVFAGLRADGHRAADARVVGRPIAGRGAHWPLRGYAVAYAMRLGRGRAPTCSAAAIRPPD